MTWKPEYSKWRHGGWYVSNISYSSGAVGCVSNNYPDGKWRIVTDRTETSFPSRDAAARAERVLVENLQVKPIKILNVGIHWGNEQGMQFCQAFANVGYEDDGDGHRVEELTSGGVFGIDTEHEPSYFREIEESQLHELLAHLSVFGVQTADFWAHTKVKV